MSLELDFKTLLREVGLSVGMDRDFSKWEAGERADVEDAIRSGQRRFYWPPGHVWSFLTPVAQLDLIASQSTYTLPDGFTGVLSDFAFADGPASRVSEARLRQLQLSSPQSGTPQYYCLRPKKDEPTSWEVVFYPTPDVAVSSSYRYRLTPLELSFQNPLPLGGPAHSETFLAACCAALEKKIDDIEGVHARRFAECLAASIAIDQELQAADSEIWPIEDAAQELGVNKAYLQRVAGLELGYGPHSGAWNATQRAKVNLVIENGLRKFYSAPGHEWSFLKPIGKLFAKTNKTSVELPEDFSALDGPLTYASGDERRIELISEHRLRSMQSTTTGQPLYCALRHLEGAYSLSFERPFDADYELTFRYRLNPRRLATNASIPLGGEVHHQSILEAVLCAAELMKGGPGPHAQVYAELLLASIARDKELQVSNAEPWDTDNQANGLEVSKAYLERVVALELGLAPHPSTWNHLEANKIRLALEMGQRNFYSPSVTIKDADGHTSVMTHEWSFLRPRVKIQIEQGKDYADLPDDFALLDGPLIYTDEPATRKVELTSDQKIRAITSSTTGRPLYACLRAVEGGYQLGFERTSDASYELEFRYRVNPTAIADSTSLPAGGEFHHETILLACLASAETIKGQPGHRTASYQDRLIASIERDKELLKDDAQVWPSDITEGLPVNKAYLKRLIGLELGYGAHPGLWNNTQVNEIRLHLETGLRNFYSPDGHEWGFLRPLGKVTLIEGQSTAELPSDFAMMDGSLSFDVDEQLYVCDIPVTSEPRVRQMQNRLYVGRPSWAALSLNSTDVGTSYSLIFDCVADQDYAMNLRYKINPATLSEEVELPLGGDAHHQTIVESCLSAVELAGGKPGVHSVSFQQRLRSSIDRDRRTRAPDCLGYNQDASDRQYLDHREYGGQYIVGYNGIEYD